MSLKKVGRNKPCHCGSGNKYKKCCLKSDEVLDSIPQYPSAKDVERLASIEDRMKGKVMIFQDPRYERPLSMLFEQYLFACRYASIYQISVPDALDKLQKG